MRPDPNPTENVDRPPEFDPVALARRLLRSVRAGSLGTIDRETGGPFASLVSVATDLDGAPLLLVSRLAGHTGNLDADPRASLLLAQGGKGDPLAHPRLTLTGLVEPAPDERARRRFLARHPKAALYADFPDFGFRRFRVGAAHLNGGFARAARLTGPELLLDLAGAEALEEAEARAVAHMNEDHRDALALYATALLGLPDGSWRATGVDPEGLDLLAGDLAGRLVFPRTVGSGGELRAALVALAGQARGAAPR